MSVFSHINFRKETVIKFQEFAKTIAPNYSEALNSMIDFFQRQGLSPNEDLGPNMVTLEKRIKKRIDAVIAIIKDIEKHQTKPTVSLLQAFLEEKVEKLKPTPNLRIEKNQENSQNKDRFVPKVIHEKLEKEYQELKNEYLNILEKVSEVSNRFGKDYLKLDLDPAELNKIKRVLKDY